MSDLGNKEIFAKNLKYYMQLNNKDRNDICHDLKFPYTTFAEWYNGKIYPRIEKPLVLTLGTIRPSGTSGTCQLWINEIKIDTWKETLN